MTFDPAEDGDGPVVPTTDVPYPYDPNDTHELDALSTDARVTKSSKNGYRVESPGTKEVGPSSSDGNPIPTGDVLMHLPVGSCLIVGVDGDTKIGLALPATETRPQVSSFGKNLFTAVRSIWPYLVIEGYAVLPEAPAAEGAAE